MRKAASLLTIIATILFFAFALSAPASADPNGPGNNGTVKIVNNGDDPMGADDRDNDPHVCQFHIYGFHFDKNSTGTWQIESWPPTGNGTVVAQGGWTADGTGQWAVAGPALRIFDRLFDLLPAGVHLQDDRLIVDLRIVLQQYQAADVLDYLDRLELTTVDRVILVRIDARLPIASGGKSEMPIS